MTETAPISGRALRAAREQAGYSQRKLGALVAERLGRADDARALQVRLNRLEVGDKVTDEDRQLVDALAAELAVGDPSSLAEPVFWIWAGIETGRLAVVAMALRIPVFTSPEHAYNARDQLALATDGLAQPFANSTLMPIRSEELYGGLLDEDFKHADQEQRRFLVEVNPDLERLKYLVGLREILASGYDTKALIEDLFLATISRFPVLVADLLQLHTIAVDRLGDAPSDTPAPVLAQWRLEEERLFAMIEVEHSLRKSWREETLRAKRLGQ